MTRKIINANFMAITSIVLFSILDVLETVADLTEKSAYSLSEKAEDILNKNRKTQ